jgi:uncharacterized Zn-finger protein
MQTSITNNPYLQNNQQPVNTIDSNNKEVNNNLKKYMCTFKGCTKSFNFPSWLRNHIVGHENERRYTCNICDKKFNQETILKRHKKIHQGKKFICLTCNIEFNRSSNLKRHKTLKIHTDNVKYNCRYCKQIFNIKRKLHQHYSKDHSLAKPFQCNACDKSYTAESSMKMHYKNTHKNKDAPLLDNTIPDIKLDINDDTMPCIKQVMEEEDNIFDIKTDFDENILFSLEELTKKEKFFSLRTDSDDEDIGLLLND